MVVKSLWNSYEYEINISKAGNFEREILVSIGIHDIKANFLSGKNGFGWKKLVDYENVMLITECFIAYAGNNVDTLQQIWADIHPQRLETHLDWITKNIHVSSQKKANKTIVYSLACSRV